MMRKTKRTDQSSTDLVVGTPEFKVPSYPEFNRDYIKECAELPLNTDEDFKAASDYLSSLRGTIEVFEQEAARMRAPFREMSEKVSGWFRPVLTHAKEADEILSRRLSGYIVEMQNRRKEAANRRKLIYSDESQALRLKIDEAETNGDMDRAAIYRAQLEAITPRQLDKVDTHSIGVRLTKAARVTDFVALVKGVAAGDVPIDALMPNEQFLREMVGKLGDDLNYQGVEVYEKPAIVRKRRSEP